MSTRAYNLLRVAALTAAAVAAPVFLPASTEAARHADETAIIPPPPACEAPRTSKGILNRNTMIEDPVYDETGRVVFIRLLPWRQMFGQALTTFDYKKQTVCFQFRSVLEDATVTPDTPQCFQVGTLTQVTANQSPVTVTATFTDELDKNGEPRKMTITTITPERARSIYERALTRCLHNDI